MILPSSSRYYALNDRTINLLMKGKIDTHAAMDGKGEPKFSDAEISDLIEQEQEVRIAVVDKNKTRSGGAFFNCLNNTLFDLINM